MMRKTGLILCLFTFAAAAATGPGVPHYRPHSAPHPQFHSKQSEDSGAVVVNAASYLPGVSPGALATVFGTNLSDVSGVVIGQGNPLPTTLANVSVDVNGIPAALFSVAYANGEDQISFQVPFETPTGTGAALIEVYDYGTKVATIISDSYSEDPGIFTYGSNYAIAAEGSTYQLIGPNQPAYPGDILVLYVTGLGPVTLNVPDGYQAPSDQLAYTQDPLTVLLAGESCRVYFSGLAPGFIGLYQINFQVPSDAPSGDLDLQIQTPYASSGTAKLSVY